MFNRSPAKSRDFLGPKMRDFLVIKNRHWTAMFSEIPRVWGPKKGSIVALPLVCDVSDEFCKCAKVCLWANGEASLYSTNVQISMAYASQQDQSLASFQAHLGEPFLRLLISFFFVSSFLLITRPSCPPNLHLSGRNQRLKHTQSVLSKG